MDLIMLIPVAAALELPLAVWIHKKVRRAQEKAEAATVAVPFYDSAEVRRILGRAYTALRKAGVCVRVPYIAGAIEAIDSGRDCPPDLAIMAIEKTWQDLPDGRYNLEPLADAIAELSRL